MNKTKVVVANGFSWLMNNDSFARLNETDEIIRTFDSKGEAKAYIRRLLKNDPRNTHDIEYIKTSVGVL